MKEYPRIAFMGTPEIASLVLSGLIENGYNVVLVVAQEDKPVGRKKQLIPVPTKKVAMEHNIEVFQPKKIRIDYQKVKEVNPDLIITCAYGQIVPQGLLDIPKLGALNIHGSILPKYRGASPIQQSLINNDLETGISIQKMVDKMDAGDVYWVKKIAISESENYTSLYQKIASAGLEALLEMLPKYLNNEIEGFKQNEEEVTFCSKITKEQEHLSLDLGINQFVGWVKGLSYQPGGYLLWDNQVFKILNAKVKNNLITGQIGEIVECNKNGLTLQLKDGQLSLLEVQKHGKNKMSYRDFVNGNQHFIHTLLK